MSRNIGDYVSGHRGRLSRDVTSRQSRLPLQATIVRVASRSLCKCPTISDDDPVAATSPHRPVLGTPGHRYKLPAVFSSLHNYKSSFAGADALAAVTLLAIAVPEQLATSRLAGMPPVTAFYAFIAGTLLFAVLGSNPQLSVGADSTIAPLFAVGIAHLASTDSARYVDLVGILAVMTGVIVVLVGLLRLGWIANFLSAPIITGFLAGVAVIIVVHQLPDLLGIPSVSGSTLHRIETVVGRLGHTNGWALGIGVITFVVVADRRTCRPQAPRRARGADRLHHRRGRSRPSLRTVLPCSGASLTAHRGLAWTACRGRRWEASSRSPRWSLSSFSASRPQRPARSPTRAGTRWTLGETLSG